jgi:hypothetical protein
MSTRDDDVGIRPGRIRDGSRGAGKSKSFVGRVMRAAKKAGHTGKRFGRRGGNNSRSAFGRGRQAALALSARTPGRRVVIMSRIVRHHGKRLRSAPLTKHMAYLKREGVTRDGQDARMFDDRSDDVDSKGFSHRCEDDRHHFRFTVSPEDAVDELRTGSGVGLRIKVTGDARYVVIRPGCLSARQRGGDSDGDGARDTRGETSAGEGGAGRRREDLVKGAA